VETPRRRREVGDAGGRTTEHPVESSSSYPCVRTCLQPVGDVRARRSGETGTAMSTFLQRHHLNPGGVEVDATSLHRFAILSAFPGTDQPFTSLI
jgi:hypothetical protein